MLDWARSRIPDVKGISAAEMSALAREYLVRDRVSRATILPETKSSGAPVAAPNEK